MGSQRVGRDWAQQITQGAPILFSIVAVPIYISTNSVGRFPFLHTLQHLLFVEFWWYLTVVSVCVSVIINNIEHLLVNFPSIWIPQLDIALCPRSYDKSRQRLYNWMLFKSISSPPLSLSPSDAVVPKGLSVDDPWPGLHVREKLSLRPPPSPAGCWVFSGSCSLLRLINVIPDSEEGKGRQSRWMELTTF